MVSQPQKLVNTFTAMKTCNLKWRYSSTNLKLGSSWRWVEKGVDASRFQVQYDWNVQKHRMVFLTAPFTVVAESEQCNFSLSSEKPQPLNIWKYGIFLGQTFYRCCLFVQWPRYCQCWPSSFLACSRGAHRADSVPPPVLRCLWQWRSAEGTLQLKSDFKSISTWCTWRKATVTKRGCQEVADIPRALFQTLFSYSTFSRSKALCGSK
jgi:hypothetical protein